MDQQEHQHEDLQHQQLHDEQHLQHPENRQLENLQLLDENLQLLENRQLENQQHPENRQLENLQLLDENLQLLENRQLENQQHPENRQLENLQLLDENLQLLENRQLENQQHPENRQLENLQLLDENLQLLENRQLENQQHPENRQLENLQLLDENLQHFEHMQETAQPQPHLMPYPGYYSLGSSLYYGTGPMHGPSSNTSRKIWQEQTLSDDQQVSVRGSRDSRMNVRHWGRRKLSVTRIEMNTERPASRSSTNDFEPLTCRSSMRAMNQSQLSDEQHRLLQQEYALHSRQLHEEQQRHLGRLKELTDHLLLHLMPVPYQEYYTLGSNINGPGPMHAPAIPHGVCDESDSDSSESDTSQESWQN